MTFATGLVCMHCGARFPLAAMHEGCPSCASSDFRSGLTPEYDYEAIRRFVHRKPLAGPHVGVWRYRHLLPVEDAAHETSMGEGATPLVPLPRLARKLRVATLWAKDESRNPTWSFKDRHAAVTVSKAIDFAAEVIVASSSGNHGISVAAYAAHIGLASVVLTFPGVSPEASAVIQAYGAMLVVTSREGRRAILREGIRKHAWYPASNFTEIPTNGAYGHEGYKTIAYELHEQLGGDTPDIVALPTGSGEGLFGVWKGFQELVVLGYASRVPRLLACEPEGGPLKAARSAGKLIARVPVQKTLARGLGGGVNSYLGLLALERSNGLVAQVSDGQTLSAQADLAHAGIFAEPASATALAGVRVASGTGQVARAARVVLVSTSGGLKNMSSTLRRHPVPKEVGPSLANIGWRQWQQNRSIG